MKVYFTCLFIFYSFISFSQNEDSTEISIPDGVLRVRVYKQKPSLWKFIKPENISLFAGGTYGAENRYNGYLIYDSPRPYKFIYSSNFLSNGDITAVKSYTFSLRAEYRMGKIFSLIPGLGIYQTGSTGGNTISIEYPTTHGGVTDIVSHKYNYLDIPICMKAMASWLRLHPYVSFGIDFGFKLKGYSSTNVKYSGSADVRDTLIKYDIPIASYIKSLDATNLLTSFTWSGGLGYYLNKHWEIQLEFRGYNSLQSASLINGVNVKLRTLTLNAGLTYHFKNQFRRSQYNLERLTKSKILNSPDQRYKFQLLADHISINFGLGADKLRINSDNKATEVKGEFDVIANAELAYIKSINKNRIREVFLKYGMDEYFFIPPRNYYKWHLVYNCFEAGFNYLFVNQNYSRFKSFAGIGAGLKQIYGAEYSEDFILSGNSINSDNVTGKYHFYIFPSFIFRLSSGFFYKFNNGQMLKIAIFINGCPYKTVILKYENVVNNLKVESGKGVTNNLNIGITAGYTIFHLKPLKKLFKKESGSND